MVHFSLFLFLSVGGIGCCYLGDFDYFFFGFCYFLWLAEGEDEVNGFGCGGGSGEDCGMVLFEYFEPVGDVGGYVTQVIGLWDVEFGEEEGGAEFGYEFFDGVGFVTEPSEFVESVEAALVSGPVDELVYECSVEFVYFFE